MKNDDGIEANIGKYYLASTLGAFGFYTPIFQLFYLASGLSVFQISLIGVVWTVVKMAVEVPSSVLADRWGRKKVLLLSGLFGILQLATIILVNDFWGLVAASAFSGTAFALLSGTDIAWFYDSLKAINKENEFDKLWARQEIYKQVPFIVSFLTSGFLFKQSPVLPFELSLFFLILSFGVILTFREPPFARPVEEEYKFFGSLTKILKMIGKNRTLRFIFIFTLMFSLGSDISYGYGQVYLSTLSFPIVLFGGVYVLKSLLVTAASNSTPWLRRKYSDRFVFGLQITLMTILFYLMVVTNNYWVGALGFILIALPHGLFGISKSSFLHKRIASHERATVDSTYSFLLALIFLVVEPIVGRLADLYSIKFPFMLIALILTIYSGYYFWKENKVI